MAGRREAIRCRRCGSQLMVAQLVGAVQCRVCQAVTRFRTSLMNLGGAPPPVLAAPPAHGRKRALLCGVSYQGRSYQLKGTRNDVKAMKCLLVQKLGFPIESVLTLTGFRAGKIYENLGAGQRWNRNSEFRLGTEDESNPMKIPTKQNMRMALRWLLQGCQAGDSLVFHYSGHGSRQKDYNGDEMDGFDEALCPTDYETEGIIIDDEINATIVRPLPRGAKLHAIMDTCYSGTILDLPFMCRMNREGSFVWEDQRLPTAAYKGTSGGLALCFSACDDNETSDDTTAFSESMTGAMTYSFVQAVTREPVSTYGSLLNSMRRTIREAKSGSSIISKEPQLSSSQYFNVYKNKFIL